jgi:hypothetical protein
MCGWVYISHAAITCFCSDLAIAHQDRPNGVFTSRKGLFCFGISNGHNFKISDGAWYSHFTLEHPYIHPAGRNFSDHMTARGNAGFLKQRFGCTQSIRRQCDE